MRNLLSGKTEGDKSNSYRELLVWQKAKRLATEVYTKTEQFPKSETFGLKSQMRRAAVSVASNIAEGQGRLSTGEFLQSLGHSRGSLLELETQLDIASDLGYLESKQHDLLLNRTREVLFLLNRLISSLRGGTLEREGRPGGSKPPKPSKPPQP